MSKFAYPAARRAAATSVRAQLLRGSMLSGAAPVRQAPPARQRGFFYVNSVLAMAAAAAGAFVLGSPAFAQTTPNNGQGTYTATGPNNISVTDQTNTGGRLEIDEAQTVTFSGLNINSSPTGQGAFRVTTYATDLTLNATGAASTFTTTANQFGILAYSQNALTANLGAVTVNAGSTGIYAYTGYGDVNLTTTGGSVTSANYEGFTLSAAANLTASLASTVMSGDVGIHASGSAVNLTNGGQITTPTYGIVATAYDGPLSLTNGGAISSQLGLYAETYGGFLTLNNTAAITSNNYYGIEAYSDNDAMSLTNSGTINSYYAGITAYSAGALTANNTGAITSSNGDGIDLSAGGDVMLTNSGAISAVQGGGLNVNTSGNIAITNTGAITAGDGLGGDTAGVGVYASGNGTLSFTSSGGAISGYDGVRLFGGTDVTVNSAAAITAGEYGLDVESSQGGAVSVTSSGTIDGSNNSGGLTAIYVANGTAGTSTLVNVNGAIGGTTAVGTGVEIDAASGSPATNTVNVNANISAINYGVFIDHAGATVNVANGVTVSSTGGYGIDNDQSGALVVNNNGGTITSGGVNAIYSGSALTLVNKAGGAISSTGDAVFAQGAANVLNAGAITSNNSSGVVSGAGSVITNAAGGSIQGGSDATYGSAIQLAGQDGVVNNYGALVDGAAGSISVNGNLASTPGGAVAVNLFAGSTTGAINFTNAPSATLSLYNGAGTNNTGVVDTATGIQLQNAGTLNAATVGAVTGNFDLVLRGQGDGTAANGAAGAYALGGSAGLQSLTKADSGTWTVSGTAAYTGATTIAAGTLALASGASIASSSNVALTDATSILDLTAANGAQTINNLSGIAGSQVRLATASSNILGKGVVPSPISNTINQTTNTIFAGNISGAAGIPGFGGGATLTKSGAATLTLTGVNSYSGPLTISAGTLALSGGGSVANTSVANAGTFDISGLTNGGASIVSLSGAGATTLGANTLTLTAAAGTVSGVISGAGGGLTVSSGTETLTGANTYTGATAVNAGATLALSGAGDISYSSGVAVNGTLDLTGVNGPYGTYTLIQGLTGGATGRVNLLNTELEISTPATFAGVISGAAAVQFDNGPPSQTGVNSAANTGVTTLTGDNTYTGSTIFFGSLNLGAGGTTGSVAGPIQSVSPAGSLNVNHSNAVTLGQVYSGVGGLQQLGSGTTTITAADTYTGATTITAGTLALSGAGSIAASSGVADNATFDISGAAGGVGVKALTGTGAVLLGANTLTLNGGGLFSGAISGTGGVTIAAGVSPTFTGTNTYSGTTTINGALALGNNTATGSIGNGAVVLNGANSALIVQRSNAITLANTISGTGSLQNSGAGPLTLTAADTYSGNTVILATAKIALTGAGSVANSAVSDAGVFDISGITAATSSIRSLSGAATGSVVLGGKTLVLSAAGGSFAGRITGAGGLTVSGGAETLTGANTYTGATSIAAGAGLTLGAGGDLSYSSGVAANGALNVAGASSGYTLIQGLTGGSAGTVALGGTYLEISTPSTFAGVISGTNGAVQFDNGPPSQLGANSPANTGVTTLTGDNTYTGGTVFYGSLNLGAGGATGSVSGKIFGQSPAGSLNVNRSNAVTLAQVIGGVSGLQQLGSGTTTLTAADIYTGATTINAGTLALSGAGSLAYSTVVDNSTLDISGAANRGTVVGGLTGAGAVILGANTLTLNGGGTYAGVASGTGGLTVATGNEVLTGNNTYTGVTTVSGGNLTLGAGGTTGSVAGPIALASGVLTVNRSNAVTLAAISGGGSLVQAGTGVTTLTGANSYTGSTTINAGTLSLTGGASIASSSGVIDNAAFDISGLTNGGATIGGLSGAGAVTLGANTLTLSGGGTYAGVASGTGGLTVTGGDEILTGENAYTGTTTVAGGNLTLGAGGTTGSVAGPISLATGVLTVNRSNAVTLAAISGGGSLVQAGTGLTTLTGVNSYTGSTTISAGTLALTGGASIASSSGVIDNATFDISGLTNGGTSVARLTGAGAVQLGANTLAISNASGVFSGVIGGAGGLTIAAGLQTLSGASTYTGATTLSGGSLTLAAGGSLASTAVNLTAAGSIFDATVLPSLTLADLSGVAGSAVKATGLVTLGSANSTTFAGALSSTGGLTKVGSGTLTLAGPNGFMGPVTINGGVLAVSGGSAIPDASVVTVGSGAGFQVLSNETVANIAGPGAIGLGSGAALTFGGDNQTSSFASFMGAGDLIKTGSGTFTLAGANSSTGRTTVSGGVLQLGANARIAGAVTVASGAALTGSGSVGALTLASGATLSPGVAPGDFGTINAASLNTAGTIRIDFGGNSTGSKSDKIVVSGAINVTGGTIDAHPTSATNDYTFNQYFALTAGTTFTGQFTNSTDFTANAYDPRLKQRVRYDLGPQAVLEVRFLQDLTAGVPTTAGGNVGGVALALNGTEQGASDSFSVLINALADESPAARQRSLQLLSGEGAVDGQELVTAGLGAFTGVLGSHLADAAGDSLGSASAFGLFDAQGGSNSRLASLKAMSNNTIVGLGVGVGPNAASAPLGLRVWGQGFAVDHHTDSNAGFASTTTSGEGFAAGVDAGLGHGVTVGAAVGYSNPQSKTSGRLAKADGDSTFGGVYARYTMGPWFGGASFAYGSTSLDLQRSVTVGALTFNPHGKTDAESYGAGFLAGYRFTLNDGSRIDPMVTLDYGHTGEDAYSETNGGVAGLRYDSVRLDEVIGTVGARWSKDFQVHGWKVTPDARLAAALAGGDLGIDTGATFLAAPTGTGSFRTLGAKTPPDWGVAGVGVTLRPLGSSIDVKLGYEGSYASRFTDHHIAATIGYRF